MKTMHKIAIGFWGSGAIFLAGLLLQNVSPPVAVMFVGGMGMIACASWFIDHMRNGED